MNPRSSATPLASLQRLAQSRPVTQESCELCAVPIAPQHRHLLQMDNNQIVCACQACALRFDGLADGRYKLVPRDVIRLPDFKLTEPQWARLALPIGLAFLFHSTRRKNMVALYPNPGGVAEAPLLAEDWQMLVADNPALKQMEADVQALLLNRIGASREYYLAPIDVCFELVGLIRVHWRGLSGGEAVWKEFDKFFSRLKGQPAAA